MGKSWNRENSVGLERFLFSVWLNLLKTLDFLN